MGLSRKLKILLCLAAFIIVCYFHIGTIPLFRQKFDWSNFTNIPYDEYLHALNDADDIATYNLSKTPEYSVTDDVRSWFGNNLSFPETLDTDFVINPSSLCPRDTWLDYLMVVKSAPGNFLRRKFIRATIGRRDLFDHLTPRLVFLLGMRNNNKDDDSNQNANNSFAELFKKEVETFNDILQGPFIDSYRNLTLKGVMGLRWMSLHCSKVKVVVHIDDDVFFNIFRFVLYWLPRFESEKTYKHLLACSYIPKGYKPIERNKSRWIVDESEFRNKTHFPFDHCNGFFVMMSGHMIQPMLNAAKVNPTFWIDDIYLYGMLPHTIGGVSFQRTEMNFYYAEILKCIREKGVYCDMVFCEYRWGGRDKEWVPLRAQLWPMLISNMTVDLRKELQFNQFITFTNYSSIHKLY